MQVSSAQLKLSPPPCGPRMGQRFRTPIHVCAASRTRDTLRCVRSSRASLRELLMADEILPPGWRIAGRPQQMAQLIIESDDVTARFLKESPTVFPGGVPAAGRNGARQAFWQPSLLEVDSPIPQLNLLLLWDYNTPGHADDGFTLRLVHPKGQGRYLGKTPIDASIPLSEDLKGLKSLRFTDAQENAQEDFFAQIDADEAEGHGFAG